MQILSAKEIAEATEKFHAHLDVCKQCSDNPFGLCAEGARRLMAVGGFKDRVSDTPGKEQK